MVIEHVFVTTLDAPETLRLATEFLSAGGFNVRQQEAFQLGKEWTSVEMFRGRKNAARARSVEELPQRVKVEWDRGRVTVAAYVQAYVRTFFSVGAGQELPANSRNVRLHAQLMTAIAQGLELLLAHRRPMQEAMGPWKSVSALVYEDARRQRRRRMTTWGVLIGIIVLLILLLIFTIASSH